MNWNVIGGVILCVLGGIEIGRSLEYQNPKETPGLVFGFGWIIIGIGEFVLRYVWAVQALLILGGVGVIWGAIRKGKMGQTPRGRRLDKLTSWLVLLAIAIPVVGRYFGSAR